MKKFKRYTKEQEEKIELLRKEAEIERQNKKLNQTRLVEKLKKGDAVFLTLEGKTISGYIMNVTNNSFDIKTPYGTFSNVHSKNIKKRFVQNLDDVEIPEVLKTKTTHQLLNMLKSFRIGYSYYGDYVGDVRFSEEQIKAELRNRPHIPTKNEKRTFKKYVTNNN